MRIHGLLLLALATTTPAGAQSLLPEPASPGRYQLQPVEGGVARLDTLTGEISLCRTEGGSLRCDPAEENDEAALSSRHRDHDDEPRARMRDRDEDENETPEEAQRKEDAEFDKALSRMKRALRAFGEAARDFENGKDGRPRDEGRMPDRT